jgi:hypothetical protein
LKSGRPFTMKKVEKVGAPKKERKVVAEKKDEKAKK